MFSERHIYILITAIVAFAPNKILAKLQLQTKPSTYANFFVQFLKEYQQFHVIIHVDNVTRHMANNFLSRSLFFTTIFNHDIYNKSTLGRPLDVNCANFVIFENPLMFSQYLSSKRNIHANDVIIFVTKPDSFDILSKEHEAIPNLNKFGRTIVLNMLHRNHVVKIYTICYYCGSTSGQLTLLQTLKFAQTLKRRSNLLPNNFENFKGHLMNVAYIDYFPYIYCINRAKVDGLIICTKAVGSEYDLVSTLSEVLNFTFRLIEAPSQNYNRLIHGLEQENFDFGIGGLSMTKDRFKNLRFSGVIRFDNLAVMFRHEKPLYLRVLSYQLFSFNLNLLLGATTFTLTLVVFLLIKCASNKSKMSFLTIFMVSINPTNFNFYLNQNL